MIKVLNTATFLIIILFNSLSVKAQPLQADSSLFKGKLENGLSYYIYQSPKEENSTSMQLVVRAGSLQETENQLGLAHFVEHMAFNGTKKYPENALITTLENMGVKFGAHLNAHTSFDETVYKLSLNTRDINNLKTGLDILKEWASAVTFDSLEIEKERGVVIEEWRSRQGSERRLSEQYLPLIFKNSRYANRQPIGELKTLRNFKRETLVDYYKTWYRPNLMAITVVTDADPLQIETWIKEQFSDLVNKSSEERIFYDLPVHKDTLFAILTDKEANDVSFSYFTKTPPSEGVNDEKQFLESLKKSFFNNLSKARFARLVQLEAPYRSASSSVGDLLILNGISSGGVSLNEEKVEIGIKQYLEEVERIRRYGFTSTEIEDYKKQYLAQIRRSATSDPKSPPSIILERLKEDFYKQTTLIDVKERARLVEKYIQSIDSAAIYNFSKHLNHPGNTVILITAPERLKERLPSESQISAWYYDVKMNLDLELWEDETEVPNQLLEKLPRAGKIVEVKKLKEIGVTKWTLSNGVNVYLKPSDERKSYFQLTGFRAGGIYSLDSTQYISALYSRNIIAASGAGQFSRNALSKYLLGNSASATMVLAANREGVAASADIKDTETLFQLLHLKWTQPSLDQKIFDRTKSNAIEAAEKQEQKMDYNYNKELGIRLRGGEEFVGTISPGRIQEELQFDQILTTYKTRFNSARDFDFVIVGDFDEKRIKPYILKYLGGLPGGSIDSEYKYLGAKVNNEHDDDLIVYAGEAPKATVNLFFQSEVVDYDYPAILKQELLQEVMRVKLRQNLREENSGVYGVGVSISASSLPSPLFRIRINFTCDPQNVNFLVNETEKEMDRIASDASYFSDELENIKKQVLLSYQKQHVKNTFWSSNLRNHIYYGFKSFDFFYQI